MALDFVITGMVCDGCSQTVERVVGELEGVTLQSVSLETGHATVDHDASVSADAIYEAIRGSGFGVRTCGSASCKCSNCNCNPCLCATGDACS